MKIICLFTVPHTGTTFMQQYLTAHPQVQHEVGLKSVVKSHTGLYDPFGGQDCLVNGVCNLVWGHIQEDTLRSVRVFMASAPTVIMLRDPLASLITRKHRHPDQYHGWLVESWIILASMIDPYQADFGHHYCPIDLHKEHTERLRLLQDVGDVLDLDGAEYEMRWAKEWPLHNSKGRYELKDYYDQRDFDKLKLYMPHEAEQLIKAERVLRPMLERNGYEDLIWWT